MHTPGPWQIGFYDGSGRFESSDEGAWVVATMVPEDNNVVVHGGQKDGIPVGVLKPDDARLIAAAPKLLEALEELLDYCTDPAPRHYIGRTHPMEGARTAIREAKT